MTTERILLLTGPNLDQLGTREPELYGTATLDDHVAVARTRATEHGFDLDHLQSAGEETLIKAIHDARSNHKAIVINAGAFTHYSWAIHDALLMFDGPVIELHITNIGAREEWRRISVLAGATTGSIDGFGIHGYRLAVDAAVAMMS